MSNKFRKEIIVFVVCALFSANIYSGNRPSSDDTVLGTTETKFRSGWKTAEIVRGYFPISGKSSGQAAAIEFIDSRKDLFKIEDAFSELQFVSENRDALNMVHVKLQQVYDNLKIFGCLTIVHFGDDQAIYLVGGQTIPTPSVSTSPSVSESSANISALNYLSDKEVPKETVYETELLIYPKDGQTYLAWMVEVLGTPQRPMRWRLFVDAHTGEVIDHYNNLPTDGPAVGTGPDIFDSVRTFGTYDIGGTYYMIDASLPMYTPPIDNYQGVISASLGNIGAYLYDVNSDNVWDDFALYRESNTSQFNLKRAYNYFYDRFGRNSYDDLGGSINALVHYDDAFSGPNNAFWYGNGEIRFGQEIVLTIWPGPALWT